MNKKFVLSKVLICSGLVSCLGANAANFKDVPKSHWAHESVTKIMDLGFVKGDPSGRYAGSRALTRYEFAKALAKLSDYYSAEIDQNKKDIENVVSVMELFQGELKNLESKTQEINLQVTAQNQIVDELNELVIALAEDYNKANPISSDGELSPARKDFEQRIAAIESDIDKLKHKGLIVDTLFKGTYNDLRKIGSATDKMVESVHTQRFRAKREKEKQQEVIEIKTEKEITNKEEPRAMVKTTIELVPEKHPAPAVEQVEPVDFQNQDLPEPQAEVLNEVEL